MRIKVLESKKTRGFLGVLCFVMAGLVVGYVLIDHNIRPIVLSVAEARVRAIASDAINRAVRESVKDVGYDDLMQVSRDNEGHISMLQANSVRMNQIAVDTTINAQRHISQIDMKTVSVPLGSAFGGPILSGRGPLIPVKIIPAGSVTSEFQTSFTSAGINQTRHEIYILLKANMRIAIPVGAKPIEVSILVPVAETVIVGAVPESYLNVDESMSGADMLQLIPQ